MLGVTLIAEYRRIIVIKRISGRIIVIKRITGNYNACWYTGTKLSKRRSFSVHDGVTCE